MKRIISHVFDYFQRYFYIVASLMHRFESCNFLLLYQVQLKSFKFCNKNQFSFDQ